MPALGSYQPAAETTQIIETLISRMPAIWPHAVRTLYTTLVGFGLGIVFGVAIGALVGSSRLAYDVAYPLLIGFSSIPKVAIVPILVLWFGSGTVPAVLTALSICFFPILLMTARGLSEVEPDLLDLVKSLRGSRWTLFRKIQLPGALPYVFSGMKVGAILAVAGAIVGEFIASERGLGYLMIQVQSSLDTPAMVMAVVLLTLLGVALYGLVLGLERMFVVRDIRLQ